MMHRRALHARWKMWTDRVRSSLFAMPMAMLVASVACALGTLALDRHVGAQLASAWWALDVGVEGTRTTLATIAGSVLTVASVAFSITVVVLQLASSQYSPRVIRNFRRDRLIQFVLGAYTGTFMYSLIVLRAISSSRGRPDFTAPISVTLAIVLGMFCMILLIALVHHIARTIQVSTIVRHLADETRSAMRHLYPDSLDEDESGASERERGAMSGDGEGAPWVLRATRDGYLDYIDLDAVGGIEGASFVRIEVRVGDFAREGDPLASIWPSRAERIDSNSEVGAAFAIADERTMQQDVRFGVRMIVDIALRALSPGINDPGTAVHCVDVLGGLLCTLAQRTFPSPERRTTSGMRVLAPRPSFDELLCLAFDEILAAASSSPPVQLAIAEGLRAVADRCADAEHRDSVSRMAARVMKAVGGVVIDDRNRARIESVATAARGPARSLCS